MRAESYYCPLLNPTPPPPPPHETLLKQENTPETRANGAEMIRGWTRNLSESILTVGHFSGQTLSDSNLKNVRIFRFYCFYI